MSRILVLVLFAAFLVVPVAAQGFAYFPSDQPSGGSTNTFPFGNAFGDNWRYHGFLTATNLPPAKIKITDVAVAPQATGTFVAGQFQMRMGHLPGSLTSVFGGMPPYPTAGNLRTCPVNLYDGPIKFTATINQWNDIGAQTSFGYDGDLTPQPNLVLEIRYRTRSTLAGQNGFRSMSDGIATMPRLWANNGTSPASPDPYTAVAGSLSASGGIRIRLTYERTCICDVAPTASIGTSIPVFLLQMPAGDFYQIAASLGQSPPLPLGPCMLGLSLDPVFFFSVLVGPPIFHGYAGIIPASGSTAGKFAIPGNPALVGLCVFHAAIAFNAQGIRCCTNTEATLLTP